MNLLVGASILVTFFCYDVIIMVGSLFGKRISNQVINYIRVTGMVRLFRILRIYRNFKMTLGVNEGVKLPKQFIVVANHQSLLDIIILYLLFSDYEIKFIAKRELGLMVPAISQILRKQEHCLIPRGNSSIAMRKLTIFAKKAKADGFCPVIFPEGTRSKDGSIGEFYPGGVRRILETVSLPIVVVALDGGWRIRNIKALVKNLKNSWYKAQCLEVIPAPNGKAEVAQAMSQARTSIEKALQEFRAQASP